MDKSSLVNVRYIEGEDKNKASFLCLASASQTLLSSESLNEEFNDETTQTKPTNNKNTLSPTQHLANKLRALTKSSEVKKNA